MSKQVNKPNKRKRKRIFKNKKKSRTYKEQHFEEIPSRENKIAVVFM